MMADIDHMSDARDRIRQAGRWLALLRFQVRLGAPVFSTGISTYAHMLDPHADDQQRQAAAAAMLDAVERQIVVETWRHDEDAVRNARLDPYRAEWQTTLRGAALETVATLLRQALQSYESAGRSGLITMS